VVYGTYVPQPPASHPGPASVHYWDADIRYLGRSRNGLRVGTSAAPLMAAARVAASVAFLMGHKATFVAPQGRMLFSYHASKLGEMKQGELRQ